MSRDVPPFARSFTGLVRQGEGPAAAFERQSRERAAERARLERVSRDIGPAPRSEGRVLARGLGDALALRGIPAVGPDCAGGAIPGTAPHRSRLLRGA